MKTEMPAHRKEVKIQTQTIVTINPKNNYPFLPTERVTNAMTESKIPLFRIEDGIFFWLRSKKM